MSRLVDQMKQVQVWNNKHVISNGPVIARTDNHITDIRIMDATQITLGLELYTHVVVGNNTSDRMEMIEEARQQIIHELYGEFRDPIMKIRYCLSNRDIDGAKLKLKELEHLMHIA